MGRLALIQLVARLGNTGNSTEAHLHFLAHVDAVTMLPNRNEFNDRLSYALAQADRRETAVGTGAVSVGSAAVELLREAFDMLEEDFEEERFFVAVRRAYWASSRQGVTSRYRRPGAGVQDVGTDGWVIGVLR